MKESWKRQRNGSNASTRFIVWEPQAAYRLRIDIREWSGGETQLGGNILLE
jgi:hypothetical protein